MMPEEFEQLLARKPFLPFRILLSEGDQFDVTRRSSIAVGRGEFLIVLPDDRWKLVPLRHVASVETLQPA